MSTRRFSPLGSLGVRDVLTALRARDARLCTVAVDNGALLVLFAVGVALDPTTVPATTGAAVESRWLKPAKFAASIALFTGTLAWLGVYLPVTDRLRRRVSWVVALGSLLEIALIAGQAARGVESHFNMSTPLNGAVYGLMGVTILAVTGAVAWAAVRTLRNRFTADIHPAFAAGIQLGLVTFVVGALQGGTIVALATDTLVGGAHVPLLGWTPTGDLRVAHFVGLHGWQVLPALGYLGARWERAGRVTDGRRLVRAAALVYTLLFTAALALVAVPYVSP